MVPRIAEKVLKRYSRQFRAIAVVGPRQSGKTTLVRAAFPGKPYVSLENPDEGLQAENDPRGFLDRFRHGAIIDEAQRVPVLFSYLQQVLDETKKTGLFILTGSNNFLLQQSITQSLAGRIGYIDLLPLSITEIQKFGKRERSTNELIFNGCYPELYHKKLKPGIWYPAYIRTYVERDVKQLRNIENTLLFTRFLQLCAGRIGQQLSVTALSNECGIDVKTVNSWLSILQSSYIIHLLAPHHRHFNKRVVKTPKLYFVDTGLACSLLGIRLINELEVSHFRAALFENFVVIELLKQKLNTGTSSNLYFWRDNKGVEVDLLIDNGKKLIPVEIKSAQTFNDNHLKSIRQWNGFSENTGGLLLYDGKQEFRSSDKISVQNWRSIAEMLI
ncbi:MAG: ATP-binding protein [Bacteroidia bacterium]|nr:ATP-binding protein [Bacteroidia bacterium]